MKGLYKLVDLQKFFELTGFHHPKTKEPYPAEHPRYQETVQKLREIKAEMNLCRERAKNRK